MLDRPERSDLIPLCPACLAAEVFITARTDQIDICICTNCGTGLSIPHDALEKRMRTLSQHIAHKPNG